MSSSVRHRTILLDFRLSCLSSTAIGALKSFSLGISTCRHSCRVDSTFVVTTDDRAGAPSWRQTAGHYSWLLALFSYICDELRPDSLTIHVHLPAAAAAADRTQRAELSRSHSAVLTAICKSRYLLLPIYVLRD
jgi:hypothetical protein